MIAGYITATTTDLTRVILHKGRPRLIDHQSYLNEEFSHFDSVFSLYLRKTEDERNVVCLGVAGPVIDNKVKATNIPWSIDGAEIHKKHGFEQTRVVNDLFATARGIFQLNASRFFTINKGEKIKNGNLGLIAPGYGLGEALMFFDGEKYLPYASEGGHSGFSPSNQMETELWQDLYAGLGHVEAEDVISLKGLIRIYDFVLATNRATKADWFKQARDKAGKLIEMALSGKDELAVKALDMFVECYAEEAANLALKGMTLGGIYLGGVIAPQIITSLDQGRFMERFIKKGKMEHLLSQIPVHVIIDDKTALVGAAALALEMNNV